MSARVSIVVPHYSDLQGLDRCLTALGRQTVAPDEIVVADNNSPEGEAAVAKVVAGRARLVIVPQKGAGPARNGGVAATSGEILAFTDSDCVPEPQWLAEGLAALGDADFVGGGMTVLVEDEAHLTAPEAFERVFAFDNESYVLKKGFTVTANLFCPRRVFDDVGGFRVGVSEDLEWCQRAGAKGYRIAYAPRAMVGHPARRTWAALEKKWVRMNEEAFALAVARPGGRVRWFLKALAMPVSAVPHTLKVVRSRALRRTGDRLKAAQVLYRMRLWRSVEYIRLLGR
jgi:GT2 family glycosyltransferase